MDFVRGKTKLFFLVPVTLLAIGVILLLTITIKPGQKSSQVSVPEQESNQSIIAENESTPTSIQTFEWQNSTPEEQGIDSSKLTELLLTLRNQNSGIHSILIIRNGKVVLDAYFYPYDGSIPHNLASVTKSFMTTLIGIAADQGKIELDSSMVSYFPTRSISNLDENKENITVKNLAGMVNGMTSGCMAGDEATLNLMRSSADWVQAALDREMAFLPGSRFCDDSPGIHLLSAILQEATGMTTLEFARQYLFGPLGIQDAFWEDDPQGYTHGWGDLYLKPRDAAKLGTLWLTNGQWNGEQIVPSSWVQDAIKPQTRAGSDSYGYGWWVAEESYYAMGRGGQYIQVIPKLDVVIVTTAEYLNYEKLVPYLEAALINPDQALPPNPDGIDKLNEVLVSVRQPEPTEFSIDTPPTAEEVSGIVYAFLSNAAKVETLSIDFDNELEATLQLRLEGEEEMIVGLIGLDGVYRQASNGWGLRGYWTDPQTFVMDIFDIEFIKCYLHFEADELLLEIEGEKVEGQAK